MRNLPTCNNGVGQLARTLAADLTAVGPGGANLVTAGRRPLGPRDGGAG
jgi:hypothetical protein